VVVNTSERQQIMTAREAAVDRRMNVFFNILAYEGKEIPIEQLIEEVGTFFAEHLLKPTIRMAYYDGTDWFHPDGTRYNQIFGEAVAVSTGHVKERFLAEKQGWNNAGGIAAYGKEAFFIMSEPGDVYRNYEKTNDNANSLTYVALPMGNEVRELAGERRSVNGYRVISIPSRELTTIEHFEAASRLFVNTETLVEALRVAQEMGANYTVSSPFVTQATIEALNNLATGLDFENFEEIVRLAEKIYEANNDPKAEKRRSQLSEYFAQALKTTNESVFNNRERRRATMEAIAEVMHYYFSLESGAAYVGLEFEDIVSDLEQHILDETANKIPLPSIWRNLDDEVDLAVREREAMRMAFLRNNSRAWQSYQVTGCVVSMRVDGDPLQGLGIYDVANIAGGYGYETETTTANSNSEMKCVECPKCHDSVNAIVTSTTIECPNCHHKVSKTSE